MKIYIFPSSEISTWYIRQKYTLKRQIFWMDSLSSEWNKSSYLNSSACSLLLLGGKNKVNSSRCWEKEEHSWFIRMTSFFSISTGKQSPLNEFSSLINGFKNDSRVSNSLCKLLKRTSYILNCSTRRLLLYLKNDEHMNNLKIKLWTFLKYFWVRCLYESSGITSNRWTDNFKL